MHGFVLAHNALLYQSLSDTLAGHHTLRLRPGDDVVVWRDHPRWLQVVRGNGKATGSSTDATIYYLSVEALKNAQMFILI